MKATISKALPVMMLFVTLSISAQINSGVGYMHGTNKKGDTATKSEYDADKAPVKDKADTTVISRRQTRASEARQERMEQQARDQGRDTDDTAAEGTCAGTDGSSQTTTETYINTNSAECVSPAWRYAAVGFGLLSLLLILLLVMGRRKDEPRKV